VSASVDFFNDVATVSSLVLFAKFVTHRTRSEFDVKAYRWHKACAISSLIALVIAFVGVGMTAPLWPLGGASASAMLVAVLILLHDVLEDDSKRTSEVRKR
jgi:peptidoglycan/LPS O-acetylase OafA/YrhL